MSAVLPASSPARPAQTLLGEWWPVLAGLAVLYLPTYASLVAAISDDQTHADYAPVALLVILFTGWQKRAIFRSYVHSGNTLAGLISLTFGLLLYIVGRSQGILILELASQIPVLGGLLLLFRGWWAVRQLWFPLAFIFFMLPFPGIFVQDVTGPLKQYDSALVEQILYVFGYPVARNGVVLTIGPYQLLVADACSGLNSIFSLSAMGLLYLYYVHHKSTMRNAVILFSIIPIAFLANVTRVIVLLLITYHFGDEAGQGFTHGAASGLLFSVSLLLLFTLDYLLGVIFFRSPHGGRAP